MPGAGHAVAVHKSPGPRRFAALLCCTAPSNCFSLTWHLIPFPSLPRFYLLLWPAHASLHPQHDTQLTMIHSIHESLQVASHAQKYFIRLNSANKKDKRRASIHDITSASLDMDVPGGTGKGSEPPSRAGSAVPMSLDIPMPPRMVGVA